MERNDIIEQFKRVAKANLPANSSLLLYGSQARGDAHEGSDWDLLILLDKPELEAKDYAVAYPFRELGWEIGEEVNPSLYTKQQWDSWTYLPYHKNVERDKIILQGVGVMIYDSHPVNTHKGALALFGNYYIRTGIFSSEDGRLYSDLQMMRNNSDYNCSYNATKLEIEPMIEPAQLLIEKIAKRIKGEIV